MKARNGIIKTKNSQENLKWQPINAEGCLV